MERIAYIRSSGRSGVERAALNAAKTHRRAITGWCPRDGIIDDFIEAPGIQAKYPELRSMSSSNPMDALELNIRDSHVTLIISPLGATRSVDRTVTRLTTAYVRRVMLVSSIDDVRDVSEWISSIGYGLDVHITGPTEQECPGAYDLARAVVGRILTTIS